MTILKLRHLLEKLVRSYILVFRKMDELTKLAIKYKTDKWGKHSYTPFYNDFFKHKRESVKSVLEIGAGEGLGLRMFRDYFPNAMIYGAEIEKDRLFKEDRIEVLKCDQSEPKELKALIKKIGGDIDLIIDDGSHVTFDQLSTCITLLPLLTSDFIYVIEDVADDKLIDLLGKDIKLGKEEFLADEVRFGERYDDRLIIVRPKK